MGQAESHDKVQGGCYCGSIRYHVSLPTLSRANCHCGNCRRAAGAQAVAWITVSTNQFEVVKGQPKQYPTDTGAYRTFCSDCGTPLTYQNDSRPDQIDITTGSLDEPERFAPIKDVYADEKLSWVPLVQV